MIVNDLLHGQALLWASCDASGVITAALDQMLRERLDADGTRSRLLRAASDEQLVQIATTRTLGLALWCVDDRLEMQRACQSLCAVREISPETICVVYAGLAQKNLLPALMEAGAQRVVCDVPSLQTSLARIVHFAPRSNGSIHPLTAGLLEHLPLDEQRAS